jgi:hypothetical protein
VQAVGGQGDGLVATTNDSGAAAIRAWNAAADGVAIWGSSPATGIGVYGVAVGPSQGGGPVIGVAGQVASDDGIGVYGTAPAGGQAGYMDGNATVVRDLQVGGAVVGYSAVVAINGSSVGLYRGDTVSLIGVRYRPDGSVIPVVGPSRQGQGVMGIADRQVTASTTRVPAAWEYSYGHWTAGSRETSVLVAQDWSTPPGASMLVATGGTFAVASVDANWGAINIGTALKVLDYPGRLVAAPFSPSDGTVVGYSLGYLPSGTGTVPILIMIR